nr:hypothetical protein BHE74_00014332 [Ipomoea batatas]
MFKILPSRTAQGLPESIPTQAGSSFRRYWAHYCHSRPARGGASFRCEFQRQQDLIDLVNGQREVFPQDIGDLGLHHPRSDVDLVVSPGEVEHELPAGEGLHGVAGGFEVVQGVELGEDVELDEADFLLVGELVESAGGEAGKGAVRGGEHGDAVGGGDDLGVDLFAENADDVDWPCRRGRRGWRGGSGGGLGMDLVREKEEYDEDWETQMQKSSHENCSSLSHYIGWEELEDREEY